VGFWDSVKKFWAKKPADCPNHDRYEIAGSFELEGVETKDGGTTSFRLLRCSKCQKFVTFPRSALRIVSGKARKEIEAYLKKQNFKIAPNP
jgi:hypothetical protein